MKRIIIGLCAATAIAACGGGNAPFGEETETETETTEGTGTIPDALAGDLESFSFNADDQTLTVRGVSLEDGPFEDVYRRRANLDRGGYQAYTAQDGSLDRHSTAYVRDIRGTRAAVAVTGGQFSFFFSGGAYSNSGNFSAPVEPGSQEDGGLVSYAGNYVGLVNFSGSGEDLAPVDPDTPGGFLPGQAAEVTGRILINASFSDGVINGRIVEREIADFGLEPENLDLAPGTIAEDGTFLGRTSVENQENGDYGGIFGGDGGTELAGVLRSEDHIADLDQEIEVGVFVLAQCGTEDADPVCDQPIP